MPSRPDGFMLHGNLGVDFFSKSELLYPNMKIRLLAPEEFNYLETLAKTFIIPAGQNQFIQENNFNNNPVRRIVIAMNTNSAFTRPFTENPF